MRSSLGFFSVRFRDVAYLLPGAIQRRWVQKQQTRGPRRGCEVSDKATSRRVNLGNVTCLYTCTDKNHKLCAGGFRRSSKMPQGVFFFPLQQQNFKPDNFVLSHLSVAGLTVRVFSD